MKTDNNNIYRYKTNQVVSEYDFDNDPQWLPYQENSEKAYRDIYAKTNDSEYAQHYAHHYKTTIYLKYFFIIFINNILNFLYKNIN